MTKKQRKKLKVINGSFENVLDSVIPNKPDGEDFFVFSIVRDDSQTPTWDQRQSCFGPWTQAKNALSLLMNIWAQSNSTPPDRILMFQGDKARSYLAEMSRQELRYQTERNAVFNN